MEVFEKPAALQSLAERGSDHPSGAALVLQAEVELCLLAGIGDPHPRRVFLDQAERCELRQEVGVEPLRALQLLSRDNALTKARSTRGATEVIGGAGFVVHAMPSIPPVAAAIFATGTETQRDGNRDERRASFGPSLELHRAKRTSRSRAAGGEPIPSVRLRCSDADGRGRVLLPQRPRDLETIGPFAAEPRRGRGNPGKGRVGVDLLLRDLHGSGHRQGGRG